MRKIFTLLTLCLLASAAWATDITFVAGTDNGTSTGQQGAFTIEKEGIKIDVANGLANATEYRFYKGKTVTFTSTVGDIVKIEFTCKAEGEAQYGPGCFTVDKGSYSYEGNIGTWEGGSNEIVFTASLNQVRATQIVVTVGDAGLAAPVLSPGAGTYYEPIKVTMTCRTPEAKIYYTTNGKDPSSSSSAVQYTAPLSLSANTTVKAVSKLNGEFSEIVEAVYVFESAVSVASLAEYAAQPDETVVKFTKPVNAVAQHNKYLYVKDNTGYGLFFGNTDQTYALGDVIPAGFIGKKTTYADEPELTDLMNFMAGSSNVEFDPEEITTANVDHAHWAHYVYFPSATIDPEAKTITDAAGTAPVYFSMGVTANQVSADTKYEVWGVVGAYKPQGGDVVYQVLPIKVKREGKVGIGNMGDYSDGEMLTFDYDATVLFNGNSRLFVKDETGCGLIYGNPGVTYKQGDVFPKGYTGKKTTYGGEPELASPFSDFKEAIRNVTVAAEPATPLDVNHDNFAHYVVMYNVNIVELSGNNFKVVDSNGNTCNGYNQFAQAVKEGFYEELYGIVGSYGNTNTVYQLLPIIKVPPTPVRSINELYALDRGLQGQFTTKLTAIYQHEPSRYLYVQDIDGTQTLVYGSVPGSFTNGDLITDAIATWNEYQGAKQMVPAENFVPDGRGNKIMPADPMPIEEISQDMVHQYLSFEEVDIITEEDKTYIVDETGRLHMFDKFEVGITGDAPYNIEGFLTIYNGELEFYPTVIMGIVGMKGDVNNDKEITVADINALINIILGADADDGTRWRADAAEDGELGIADINAIIDMILSN